MNAWTTKGVLGKKIMEVSPACCKAKGNKKNLIRCSVEYFKRKIVKFTIFKLLFISDQNNPLTEVSMTAILYLPTKRHEYRLFLKCAVFSFSTKHHIKIYRK